jgi:RHS repeat-associated protein
LDGTSLLLDDDGEMVSEISYYPFGLARYEMNGSQVRYGFTGKELDTSGLHYYGARYYDALIGRFIRTDPLYFELPERGTVFPQLLNLYAYTVNNPVRFVDPNGTKPQDEAQKQKVTLTKIGVSVLKTGEVHGTAGKPSASSISIATGLQAALDPNGNAVSQTQGWIGALSGFAAKYGHFAGQVGAAGASASLARVSFLGTIGMMTIDALTFGGRARYEAQKEVVARESHRGSLTGFAARALEADPTWAKTNLMIRRFSSDSIKFAGQRAYNEKFVEYYNKADALSPAERRQWRNDVFAEIRASGETPHSYVDLVYKSGRATGRLLNK